MTASANVVRTYGDAQRFRRVLIEAHGIDSWRVTATPNAELDRLLPVQLELVAECETVVMPCLSGMRHDEMASVVTFARGELVSAWASADDMTPWDSFEPDGAA